MDNLSLVTSTTTKMPWSMLSSLSISAISNISIVNLPLYPEHISNHMDYDFKGYPKPDVEKVRAWTDRSRKFTVEAQCLGLMGEFLYLHKTNGVRIKVPLAILAIQDLEHIEAEWDPSRYNRHLARQLLDQRTANVKHSNPLISTTLATTDQRRRSL